MLYVVLLLWLGAWGTTAVAGYTSKVPTFIPETESNLYAQSPIVVYIPLRNFQTSHQFSFVTIAISTRGKFGSFAQNVFE